MIMIKYVLRIVIFLMIIGFGMNFGKLFMGIIIVELVFFWFGFGCYFIEVIFNCDIFVI